MTRWALLLLCACEATPLEVAPVPGDSPVPTARAAASDDGADAPAPKDSSTAAPGAPGDDAPVPKDSFTAASGTPGDGPDAPVPKDSFTAAPGAPDDGPDAPVPKDSPPTASPPPGFVDLRVALPDACFTAGYAAADNFTGAPLPGYAAPGAWLLADAAAALARTQAELRAEDLSLQIFDAYRPRRASEAMVAWAERTGRAQLLVDGYIARRSGHNHGHTVDLGLARRGSCEPLDMGTAWDTLDTRSHTANATGAARSNRRRLLAVMRAAGFHAYPKEWWHFTLPLPNTRPRDVPYGPHEASEAD